MADYRIFGYDQAGQIRANLYDGPECRTPGNRYSWLTAKTAGHLAFRLERQWEEPLTSEEWDAIDELLNASETPCEDCGGAGRDGDDPSVGYIGSVCAACHGSGIEPQGHVLEQPAPAGNEAAA